MNPTRATVFPIRQALPSLLKMQTGLIPSSSLHPLLEMQPKTMTENNCRDIEVSNRVNESNKRKAM